MKVETKMDIRLYWAIFYNVIVVIIGGYELYNYNGLTVIIKAMIFLSFFYSIGKSMEKSLDKINKEFAEYIEVQRKEILERIKNNIKD